MHEVGGAIAWWNRLGQKCPYCVGACGAHSLKHKEVTVVEVKRKLIDQQGMSRRDAQGAWHDLHERYANVQLTASCARQ